MPLFAVEGVVGAGKTSFLKIIANSKFATDHIIVFEPVDNWMNIKLDGSEGKSIFEKFYEDKQRHGFMFQMLALQTRIAQIIEASQKYANHIIICERSQLSDAHIFAKMLYEMNCLSKEEYYVYQQWFDMCTQYLLPKVSGIIYIETPPSICVDRIMQRSRCGEENISFDYIKRLHLLHTEYIEGTDLPVCRIDGKISVDTEEYNSLVVDKVKDFCNSFVL